MLGWQDDAHTNNNNGDAMAPRRIDDRLLSWADDLDDRTVAQATASARLPVVHGHVALMPDAHLGYGATVGSVIPTRGAVIPSAAGVDLGCGMAAVRLDATADDLPDDLSPLLGMYARVVPAGVGVGHGGHGFDDPLLHRIASRREHRLATWLHRNQPRTDLTAKQAHTTQRQAGSLGSGNHFAELSVDGDGNVWVVLHSGSRGIGNQLATRHIDGAKDAFADLLAELGHAPDAFDADLAWLAEHTPAFDHYVADMLWAQGYALLNRDLMLDAAVAVTADLLGLDPSAAEVDRVTCHHNYCERETHDGVGVWVTRKGAIRARLGDRGIIPGSMGTSTFLVRGLGNADAWQSSSHGAGRVMSRTRAKKDLDRSEFAAAMRGRTWQADKADRLIDEAPAAYRDIHAVMRQQSDLVEVEAELTAVLNYKGVG